MSQDVGKIKSGRVLEILKRTISNFILEISDRKSIVTVRDIEVQKAGGSILVICSVFPIEDGLKVQKFLRKNERNCKEYIKKNTSLRIIPTVHFFVLEAMAR